MRRLDDFKKYENNSYIGDIWSRVFENVGLFISRICETVWPIRGCVAGLCFKINLFSIYISKLDKSIESSRISQSSCFWFLIISFDQLRTDLNNGKQTVTVFLNVKKEFDCVSHDSLRYKLNPLNQPLSLIKIIDTFLYNRTSSVRNDNHLYSTR